MVAVDAIGVVMVAVLVVAVFNNVTGFDIFLVGTVYDRNLRPVSASFFVFPSPFARSPSTSCHHESNNALQNVLFPSPARPATIIFREIMRGDNFNDSGDPIEYDGDVAPLSLTEGISLATGLFQVEEASARIIIPPPKPRQQTINGNKENIGIVVSFLSN